VVTQRVTVAVKCYSGYRSTERPTSFVWAQKQYEIERVVKQWRTPDEHGFLVVVEGGDQFVLTYHEHLDQWSLHLPQQARTLNDSTPLHAVDNHSSTPLTRKEHNIDA